MVLMRTEFRPRGPDHQQRLQGKQVEPRQGYGTATLRNKETGFISTAPIALRRPPSDGFLHFEMPSSKTQRQSKNKNTEGNPSICYKTKNMLLRDYICIWKVAQSKAPTRRGLQVRASQDARSWPSKIEAGMPKGELGVPELMPALRGTPRCTELASSH